MSIAKLRGSADSATELNECPAGVSHLLVAADALSPGRWGAHITLCGAKLRTSSATVVADEGSEWDPEGGCYCPECVREAQRWVGEASWVGEGGHPPWCSPGHCYLSDGVRVHVQCPVRCQDDTAELEFTSRLVQRNRVLPAGSHSPHSTRDPNVSAVDEAARADALRAAMIAELRGLGAIRSDRVAAAVGTVARHLGGCPGVVPRPVIPRARTPRRVAGTLTGV